MFWFFILLLRFIYIMLIILVIFALAHLLKSIYINIVLTKKARDRIFKLIWSILLFIYLILFLYKCFTSTDTLATITDNSLGVLLSIVGIFYSIFNQNTEYETIIKKIDDIEKKL